MSPKNLGISLFFRKLVIPILVYNTNRLIYPLILIIALILSQVFMRNVLPGHFLFIHDEYLNITKDESLRAFFVQDPTDLGTSNTTTFVVTAFDRFYYLFTNLLNLNLIQEQYLLYFIKVMLLLFLPFWGLSRINREFGINTSNWIVFLVTFFYAFNTYTLIYFHGNAFTLTLLICYALAPVTLSYFHQSIINNKFLDKLKTVILLFLMSFAIYLFLVFVIFLILYSLLLIYFKQVPIKKFLLNILYLAILYLPFSLDYILVAYDMMSASSLTVNTTGGDTYSQLQGGLLYQLLMWFSWGIYTYWSPRNIFTFSDYFKSIQSLIAPFIVYGLIIVGLIKKNTVYVLSFFVLFLFFILFSKGAQQPLGQIYLYLINHSAIFRVFRSPDNKFGFGVVLSLVMLLLLISNSFNKLFFSSLLCSVIFIQGFLIFNGTAIIGQNTATSYDRIVTIPKPYLELKSYLDQHSFPYGYIMPLPSSNFDHFRINNKVHIGQDILPKISTLPFVYLTEYSGMNESTYERLNGAINSNNMEVFNQFPIRYFLIRNDIQGSDITEFDQVISHKYNLVFENEDFKLYENPNYSHLINGQNVSYKIINPIKYKIEISDFKKPVTLYFDQNYNNNWFLYPLNQSNNQPCINLNLIVSKNKLCINLGNFFTSNDLISIFKSPVFQVSHSVGYKYSNSWIIDPQKIKQNFPTSSYSINKDGSINLNLLLYFKPQIESDIIAFTMAVYIVIIIFIIFIKKIVNEN